MIHLASLESTLETEVALGCAWNNSTLLSCPGVHLNSIMRANQLLKSEVYFESLFLEFVYLVLVQEKHN